MDKAKALVEWLSGKGELKFDDFVVQARAAGVDPIVWHKAKRQGLVETTLRAGVLYIKAK